MKRLLLICCIMFCSVDSLYADVLVGQLAPVLTSRGLDSKMIGYQLLMPDKEGEYRILPTKSISKSYLDKVYKANSDTFYELHCTVHEFDGYFYLMPERIYRAIKVQE